MPLVCYEGKIMNTAMHKNVSFFFFWLNSLHTFSHDTLVACLSVACLSVRLSPDCLQPDKSEEKHCLSICRLSVCPHAAYWLWPACPSSCPLSSRCLSPACRYLYLPGANPITKIHACAESPLLAPSIPIPLAPHADLALLT